MKFAIVFALCALIYLVHTATPDVDNSLDFAAAAPKTYNHLIGGGAWNQEVIGRDKDIVESLEGDDFACGDYVTHFIKLPMIPYTHAPPVNLTMTYQFTADSTGQSGVAYGDFGYIGLNEGNVRNGGRTTQTVNYWTSAPFGLDTYVSPNPTGAYVRVVKKWLEGGGMFVSGGTLWVTIKINNLLPGVHTVIRIDVRIFCLPGSRPTGNLQGALVNASQVDPAQGYQVLTGGMQTVPLKNVNNIVGIAACIPSNITGIDFNATVTITDPNMGTGGTTARFYYSWANGGFIIIGTSVNFTEIHTYDEKCSPSQEGQLQYNRGICGCEVTSILSDQPRFFFTPSDTYYNMPPTTVVVNGVSYLKYTNKTSGPVLSLLYTQNPPGTPQNIFRAYLTDGRIMTFTNVNTGVPGDGTVPNGIFVLPNNTATTCLCNRVLDIQTVMDRSFYVTRDSFWLAQNFAAQYAAQFNIGPNNVLIGTSWYDGSYARVQAIKDGNTLTNVQNALRSILCVSGSKGTAGCGVNGASVDVANAIRQATADLMASPRVTTAAKAIVLITTGWNASNPDVVAAVNAAEALNIKVISAVYNNIVLLSDLVDSLAPTEPRFVVNQFTASAMASDAGLPYLLQLTGTICLAAQNPCGSSCCGKCDTTCGICQPVTNCDVASNNCSSLTDIIGGCCVNTGQPGCPDIGNCQVGTCNTASGVCSYTSTCVATQCKSATCVNNVCNRADLAATEFCRKQVCDTTTQTLSWTPRTDTCPVSDKCNNYVCNSATSSCDRIPVPNNYTLAPCETNRCDPLAGWTAPQPKVCANTDPCKTVSCDATSGNCIFANKCTKDPLLGLCDLQSCDATGTCSNAKKDCTPNSNRCFSSQCVPATGQCLTTSNKTCGLDANGCNTTVCNNATGVCNPVATAGCGVCTCPGTNACNRKNCDASNNCIGTIAVTCTPPDSCKTANCNPTGPNAGCQYTDIDCTTVVTINGCEEIVKDPSAATCCSKRPKNCTGPDLCRTYSCNPTGPSAGCQSTYACTGGNACYKASCTTTGCSLDPPNCPTSTNLCEIPSCDNTTGCLLTLKNCNLGNDPCTVYSCEPTTGLCLATPKSCDDGNLCTTDTCDATGTCKHAEITCDDGVACTTDGVCDTTTGACPTKALDHVSCQTIYNPCVNWTCTATGCVSANFTCPATGATPCSAVNCIDFLGCTLAPKVCTPPTDASHSVCTTASCDDATGTCLFDEKPCQTPPEVVIGAAVGTAAVVGIIIAVVACVGISSGASYAVYQKMSDGDMGTIKNNPLFVARGADMVNPLYANS